VENNNYSFEPLAISGCLLWLEEIVATNQPRQLMFAQFQIVLSTKYVFT